MKISKNKLYSLADLLTISFSVLFFGFTLGNIDWNKPVHAQSASPSYVCTFGNGGTSSTYPCVQYIVNVSTARLGGGVDIYQVQSNPVDVSTLDQSLAANGAISGTSVQEPLPNNNGETFTLSVSKP